MIQSQKDDEEYQDSQDAQQETSSETASNTPKQDCNSSSDSLETYPEPNEKDRVVFDQESQEPSEDSATSEPEPSAEEQNEYMSALRLSVISFTAAAISMFFGGVVISVLSLGFAIIAYQKIMKYCKSSQSILKNQWVQYLKLVRIATVLACASIVLNLLTIFDVYSYLENAANAQALANASDQASAGNSTTWG